MSRCHYRKSPKHEQKVSGQAGAVLERGWGGRCVLCQPAWRRVNFSLPPYTAVWHNVFGWLFVTTTVVSERICRAWCVVLEPVDDDRCSCAVRFRRGRTASVAYEQRHHTQVFTLCVYMDTCGFFVYVTVYVPEILLLCSCPIGIYEGQEGR